MSRYCTALLLVMTALPAWAQQGDAPGGGGVVAAKPVTGEQVYVQVCQACHMADAKGGSGAATIPALAGNPRLATPGYPVSMIVRGRGAMPGLTDLLDAAQIAAVATYVRTHFGNAYSAPVTADDVTKLMAKSPQ